MKFEYRRITDDELADWRRVVRRGFNEHARPDEIELLRKDRIELDRAFAAFDDGQPVSTGGFESHLITVPGEAQIPMGGIAYIGTAPTHRGQGALRGMMKTLLTQCVELGEPLVGLRASQSAIYERYGFGISTQMEFWRIAAAHGAIAHSVDAPGKVRFLDADAAMPTMKQVYEAMRRKQVGALDRSDGLWRYNFYDPEQAHGGASALFFLVYESPEGTEGYAAYRTRHPDDFASDDIDITVQEMVTATDEAHAALWKFLLNMDLLRNLSVGRRAPDDPLWWMLADPRQLERKPFDGLWLRLMDPVKALSARTYRRDGKLILKVTDAFWPEASGTYQVDSDGDTSECRKVDASPDIEISAAELGAIYLGGAKLADLARAGRVKERTDAAIAMADAMFGVAPLPWACHSF